MLSIIFFFPVSLILAKVADVGVGLPGKLEVGQPLPDLPPGPYQRLGLENLRNDKNPPQIKDSDGRYGILFVWRQGSTACRNSLAWISDLADRRPELRLLSIHTPRHSWEHETDSLKKLLSYHHTNIPVLLDHKAIYWHAAGFSSYPTFVLFDPQGVVISIHEGDLKVGSRGGNRIEKAYEESLTSYLRSELRGSSTARNE